MRRSAEKSLFGFSCDVLGYDRLDGKVHRELCAFLEDEGCRNKLILMPRGSFKSTIISMAYPLWRLVRNSNEHILLDSRGTNLAKRNLSVIKSHVATRRRFRELFGNWRPAKGGDLRWNTEQVDVLPRTDLGRGDPSLQAFGLDQSNVGFHFGRIICDDLHDEKNTRTDDQIAWVRTHLRLLESVLDPGGELIVVGTRWADNDIYGGIIEEAERGEVAWSILKRRAYNDDGSLLLPSVLSAAYLAQQQAKQTPAMFSAQYLNDPLSGGRQMFSAPYHFFDGWYDLQASRLRVEGLYELRDADQGMWADPSFRAVELRNPNVYLLVDPAGSEEKRADETAIVAVAVTSDNRMWVMDAAGGRLSPSEAVRAIYRMARKWRPICVGIELQGLASYLQKALRDAERQEKYLLPIKSVKPKARSKDVRIRVLEPRHRGGTLLFHRDLRTHPVFTQFNRFPVCRFDDYLDALAYGEDIVMPSSDEGYDTESEQPAVERYAHGIQVAPF